METKLTGHHVLLRAGSLRLLVPQAEVGAAEYRECEPTATPQAGVFEVPIGGQPRRVIFPSERLRPLEKVVAPRYVMTRLDTPGAESLWFAWDEVRVMINADLRTEALPPALRGGARLPATSYLELNDELVLVAKVAHVVSYLCAGVEACA